MSELYLFNYDYPRLKLTKKIRLIELFGGIGAQAKALRNASIPFESYYLCELDKAAVESYNAIHNTNYTPVDIRSISASDLNIVETNQYSYILTYSFPCQDLAICGKQQGMSEESGTRSSLLWEVLRLLKECNELPQVLLMENVTQIHNQKNEEDFQKLCFSLSELGYTNYFKDINSKWYVPQNRNRCFMVSILGNYSYEFPEPKNTMLNLQDYLVKQDCWKKVNGIVVDGKIKNSARTIFERDKNAIKTSSKNIFACECKSGWQDNKVGVKLSPALRAGNNNTFVLDRYEQGSVIRKLTAEEFWLLMGFSKADYEAASKVCGVSQLYKQAGNSIVVDVLSDIFKQML